MGDEWQSTLQLQDRRWPTAELCSQIEAIAEANSELCFDVAHSAPDLSVKPVLRFASAPLAATSSGMVCAIAGARPYPSPRPNQPTPGPYTELTYCTSLLPSVTRLAMRTFPLLLPRSGVMCRRSRWRLPVRCIPATALRRLPPAAGSGATASSPGDGHKGSALGSSHLERVASR